MEFVVKVNGVDVAADVLREHRPLARHARRFGPGSVSRAARMHLLVGIDTEGDNQWDAAARAHQTFENIYALPRLHALFARHGVRPTYVITYPVATDPRSAEVLRALLAGGDCEIGAHHHAWETPPCTAEDVARHPYASTLPRAQFEAQLAALTERDRGGGRRSAGVVSLGPVRVLRRPRRRARAARLLGRVERRAAVLRGAQGRARVRRGAADAVLPRRTTAPRRPGTSNVLEVPVSAALNRRLPHGSAVCLRARAAAVHDQARAAGAAARCAMRWLRPSYSSLDDMIALARDLARAGEPVLNLLFHSSEAIVGGSPYNRTQAELDAFCDRLERFLAFADARSAARRRSRSREFAITRLRRLMRILHVTPHLPPDQAANALLPWQLGNWAREARRRRRVRRASRRAPADAAELAGPVTWIAAPSRRLLRPHAAARLGVAA